MSDDWTRDARRDLQALCGPQGNFGYKKGASPGVEPSALSWLGLLASGNADSGPSDLAGARLAAEWMATIQHADGSMPVAPGIETPGWTTPLALLLWSGLSGFETPRRRARNRLLRTEGRTLRRDDPSAKLFGHDVAAVGWPWAAGTHSWLDPTAMAILALCREGLSAHRRVEAGIHLILDRSLEHGGWNFGNRSVLGRELRAQPGPSGLALLALAARRDDSAQSRRGIDYLLRTLGEVRTGVSLGWGILGLRAWDACPRGASTWLGESYNRYAARPDQAVSLALLLLAASERGLDLLVKPAEGAGGDRSDARSPGDTKRSLT